MLVIYMCVWEGGDLPSCVQAKGNLVAVHHDIGPVAVLAGGVGRLATQEDAGVGIHGGLVRGHGLVEFPDDDALRVVEEVFAHAGDVLDDGDAEGGELLLGAQAGEEHEARGVDCAGAEDGLARGGEDARFAGLEGESHAQDLVGLDVDLADPCVCEDGEVLAGLFAAEDGVDVGDRGAAPAAVVGVVGDGEEADGRLEAALGLDLVVEVMDDGDIHGRGARIDPVEAELVPVVFVHGLDRVAQVVQHAGEGLEGPAFAALGFPSLAVVLEGAERDEGVVRGAPTEHLCARVADVRVAHGLLRRAVVVVELAAQQVEPVLEQEHAVVHEVAGAGLDQEDFLVGQVFRESRGNDTASCATAHDDKVPCCIGGDGGGSGRCHGHG